MSVFQLLLAAMAAAPTPAQPPPGTPQQQAERFLRRLMTGDIAHARAALPRDTRFQTAPATLRHTLNGCVPRDFIDAVNMGGGREDGILIALFGCPGRAEAPSVEFYMVRDRIVRVRSARPPVTAP